ncbi:indolepyruvate oxidoreductase subunit beta [Vallitalea sp.]|jgi:indolepyruvate ferredoxin oxidoreductase beta subunit|uniref:indolepyruvate oxidoreductase subunit beta n=1 Tax=Vallitalea sp. TaxID=1882829 RepID=UPI0025DB827A|nr:indolepyruvate oxidoreductase subunit beta [Vallitalea sp.]MCT4688563.1 indolepyruvate oxidoreductase subunit beta [Vallitalea sp.]
METKNILVVGVGGQGTLLTSRILGNLAIHSGYDVKLSEVHGMSQRGGSVVTHIRYGDKVYSPLVEIGKADIILAFEKMEALRWRHYLKKDGLLIVNAQEIDPMPVIIGAADYPQDIIQQLHDADNKVIVADALSEARKIGNFRVVNTVLLGLLAKNLDEDKDKWEEAIKQTVPSKTVEVNVEAFEAGYAL